MRHDPMPGLYIQTMRTVTHDARGRRRTSLFLGLLLLPLLGLLLTLQARWLGDLAAAQSEEMRRVLQTATERMASEFQATLAEIEGVLLASSGDLDAVVLPFVTEVFALEADEEQPTDVPAFVAMDASQTRWLVVLDTRSLEQELFPALARSALGAEALETYRVSVVPVEGDGAPLYRSGADGGAVSGPPDASADLSLLPNRWRGFFNKDGVSWTELDAPVFISAGGQGNLTVLEPWPARWRIEVRHRLGSLELAFGQARTRNVLLGGGVLVLLIACLALLWVAEKRARRLAEKELAFVAGISHELRTPLAVVRMAASNLEQRVVTEPERVAEYGGIIEREVTRVATLVERVLRFSGDEDGPVVRDEVDVETWIRDAVERCRPWRDRRRFEVEIDVAQDARTVRADGAALTSALHNLVENAIKYGADDQTIHVTARRDGGIVVEVSDSGPGVDAEDRARLFDPFYRGAHVRGGSIPGNGLGLGVAREIARAHGGRLELVETEATRRGAVFALYLPTGENGDPR